MRKPIAGVLVALAIPAAATLAAPGMTPKQQADFEKALADRTEGAPEQCVHSRLLGRNEGYGEGVILFRGAGNKTVYVNYPSNCPALRWDRMLRTYSQSNQLCRGDVVHVLDRASGMENGRCTLGEFIPYSK